MRKGYGGEPVDDPIFVQVHFGRRASIMTPACL
jgi:hypothetical protein